METSAPFSGTAPRGTDLFSQLLNPRVSRPKVDCMAMLAPSPAHLVMRRRSGRRNDETPREKRRPGYSVGSLRSPCRLRLPGRWPARISAGSTASSMWLREGLRAAFPRKRHRGHQRSLRRKARLSRRGLTMQPTDARPWLQRRHWSPAGRPAEGHISIVAWMRAGSRFTPINRAAVSSRCGAMTAQR
jgi:hypothetical protein